nr:putative uncharacterized protein FLJ36797 [Symphalangus syndactylus]
MTSVASLPEQSPGCRCRSLTGAGARTSAAGPLARLLPRRRLPPPHLPTRPPPGGGHEIKATRGGGRGDFGWSPRAAAPGVAMNGWMPRALGPPGTTNKQPLSSREEKASILLLNSVP